jgi:hypothetical protein
MTLETFFVVKSSDLWSEIRSCLETKSNWVDTEYATWKTSKWTEHCVWYTAASETALNPRNMAAKQRYPVRHAAAKLWPKIEPLHYR